MLSEGAALFVLCIVPPRDGFDEVLCRGNVNFGRGSCLRGR